VNGKQDGWKDSHPEVGLAARTNVVQYHSSPVAKHGVQRTYNIAFKHFSMHPPEMNEEYLKF
jgi:hypothetical protein